MDYRVLGKTGLRVSVVSLGGSPLGGVFGPVEDSQAIRAVHTAFDLGINYVDTAPFYAATNAETVLGKALKGQSRDRYYLATKVGRYGIDDFDFSAKRVIASVDDSLQRLGVNYVDLIQCHDIEFGSLDQVVSETIPALRRVCEQGKARFIGITGLPLKIFPYVLDRAEGVDTVLSWPRYTLHNTSLEELVPYLEMKNIGIINAAVLSCGLLTERGAPGWFPPSKEPAADEIKATCARAVAYCRAKKVRIEQLALQFAVANPRIHTNIVGTADPAEITQNVRWVESPVDRELLNELESIFQPIRAQLWSSGRPENN
jgi:L-galactose dehydrogenase